MRNTGADSDTHCSFDRRKDCGDRAHQPLPKMRTRLDMLEEIERIPVWEVVAINALTWLLLAGYLVFPSTFASIRKSDVLNKAGDIGRSVDHVVRNVPLIYFASFLCLLSSAGLGWFWWRRRTNYIWALRRISL